MSWQRLGIDDIARVLEDLGARHGGRPHLRFDLEDPRVDWAGLAQRGQTELPSEDEGAQAQRRWTLPDTTSVHGHWFFKRGEVQFSLDRVNPEEDTLGYLLEETQMARGALGGAVLGAVLTRNPLGALVGGAVGALGLASILRGPTSVWVITRYRGPQDWELSRVDGAETARAQV